MASELQGERTGSLDPAPCDCANAATRQRHTPQLLRVRTTWPRAEVGHGRCLVWLSQAYVQCPDGLTDVEIKVALSPRREVEDET